MTIITDTIKPFVTPFKAPELLDLRDRVARSIKIQSGVATIYDDVNNSITVPIWAYEGQFPGPSLLMNKDQQIDITWVNAVDADDAKLPCLAVEVDGNITDNSQNVLGLEIGYEKTLGDGCKPHFTTHLHGGKIPPASDGWPESMLLPGQNSLKRYENRQRAALIWYHDHAMHTTRLNVYAGMAGAWIITDQEEAALQLPAGDKMLPMIIQDRNLTFGEEKQKTPAELIDNETGKLNPGIVFNNPNTKFLHKVEGYNSSASDKDHGPMEFAGPLTLVNGRIWPVKDVEPSCYRLRMLNGSNSRTYGLVFAEVGEENNVIGLIAKDTVNAAVYQIGTDGGLLDAPKMLPSKTIGGADYPVLILSPAERADLLIDFSHGDLAGKKIVLLNCAASPFANEFINPLKLDKVDKNTPMTIGEVNLLVYPQVMMFKVSNADKRPYCFCTLKDRFEKLAMLTGQEKTSYQAEQPHFTTCEDKKRTIAIVEKTVKGKPMLVLWELLKCCELDAGDPVLIANKRITVDEDVYFVTAERFQDPVSYMVEFDSTERWRFINLTADTHPMHLHLVQFIAQSRVRIATVNGKPMSDGKQIKNTVSNSQDHISIGGGDSLTIDANEQGFKDTIRVNPGEMVDIEAKFDGYMGRYVYHCHLLEHEDHDMMRQFVVTRGDLNHESELTTSPISVGHQQ